MIKHMPRSYWIVTVVLLAACAPAASSPTLPPSSATPPQLTATPLPLTAKPPAATPASAALRPVPRNRTVQMGWPFDPTTAGVTNPLSVHYSHQAGNSLLWEGLAYYAIFADKEIPWLAQSMDYTKPDFTELTIKLNPLARWSDGQPVTAQDVLFTLQLQLDKVATAYHQEFQHFVQAFRAVDDHTVVLTFKIPAPHFKFDVLTLKFDTGLEIVPAHVLSSQPDITNFSGELDIVHSGPYNLVYRDTSRNVFDLRPDWWAVAAGLIAAPAVQRVIVVDISTGSIDALTAKVINNDIDTSVDLPAAVMINVLTNNPKVTTYAGNAPPYGSLDWWPNALWVNTQLAPYSDVRVRRALNRAIDRDAVDQFMFQGAPLATIYPFPLYPGLQRFADSPQMKALEAKYQPRKFDLAESAQLMTAAGFSLNADKLWARDGQTVSATVGSSGFGAELAPVLAQMLRRAGFAASVDLSDQAYDHMLNGGPGLYLFGHGASLIDPYATLEMFHSRHSAPAGTPVTNNTFSRYNNPAYDQLLDAMAVLPANDPKFQALAAQAMEIYWRDVIDIPIVQWLHRIPYNQTYWTNWPTHDNPAMGTNGALWHNTAMLVITSLKPAQ